MKQLVTAAIVAATALAAEQSESWKLAEDCYYDEDAKYDSTMDEYSWGYEASTICPSTTNHSYYGLTYSCDVNEGTICTSDYDH